MDELQEFCRRVLGPVPAATAAADRARAQRGDRIGRLALAAQFCRRRTAEEPSAPGEDGEAHGETPQGLREAVAAELAAATARLPERQREALALRELLGLGHHQIGQVLGLEASAVAPLLARARLGLRAERRGTRASAAPDCPDGERSLRDLALRQDGEALPGEDEDWLHAHLVRCEACETAHAAMLEASVCYRAWPRSSPHA